MKLDERIQYRSHVVQGQRPFGVPGNGDRLPRLRVFRSLNLRFEQLLEIPIAVLLGGEDLEEYGQPGLQSLTIDYVIKQTVTQVSLGGMGV